MTLSTTIAIVVTYFPNRDAMSTLVSSLREQVSGVIIVDNGSPEETLFWIKEALSCCKTSQLICLGVNQGIAAAQNVAIQCARDWKADAVVLFDQDSFPALDMVARLYEAKDYAEKLGNRVGAIGANFFDERHANPPPFIRVEGWKRVRARSDDAGMISKVDYLISSGCLIPMPVLDAVGGMREELFIDYVDIEWGLRAQRDGFQLFGAFQARMHHQLGDAPMSWFGRTIPTHSALRHYYHFRNAIWLYKQPWVPVNWKVVDAWRLLLKFIFYTLNATPRLHHARMMGLGLWHGVRGRMHEFE